MFSTVNIAEIKITNINDFTQVWLINGQDVPKEIQQVAADCGFMGRKGELKVSVVNQMVNILVSVEEEKSTLSFHQKLRLYGDIFRSLSSNFVENVCFANRANDVEAIACAAGLLTWNSGLYKSNFSQKDTKPSICIGVSSEFICQAEKGIALSSSINFARTLGQTPPNIATPFWIASEAEKMAKEFGLKCEVFKDKELEDHGCVGLITVGKASENKPCMIRLEYSPNGETSDEEALVLVGKTVCYDTGGLSLKINNGMVGMKHDKDGGCAVIGAMQAIASVIKPNRKVVALLCAAENSISDNAYRPDDVMIYPNGISVEVTNTDAEVRLVLADGLIWATTKEKPAAIVDIATLTGGVVTALGKVFAGAFCNSDELYEKALKSANESGERIWRLPLDAEYHQLMKSQIADLINSNPNRQAHPVQGATFLESFVPPEFPWLHLDIAGVHYKSTDSGAFIEGPVGFGVLFAASLSQNI